MMIQLRVFLALAALLMVGGTRATELGEAITADSPYVEALFRHFHANPELSMQEPETAERLAAELETLGYVVTRKIGKTGLVETLRTTCT